MKIVKTGDLVAADLPNLEAPFFAAVQARSLLLGDHSGHFNPARLLGRLPSSGGRASGRLQLIDEVTQKIQNGELWLVYGICDGKPFDPVIRWQEATPGQGHWVLNGREARWALDHSVNGLNENDITPQQLAGLEAGGIGFLPASNFAQELRLKRREDALQQPSAASPQSPFPARPVAPLPATVAAPEQTTTEPAPEIHLEVGLFTDGTLNNADNSRALEEQVKATCLDPLKRGEISEEECQYRLGLMMGDSYANAPSNVAKLADLYSVEDLLSTGARRHRLSVYYPGPGTKTGDEDSPIGMITGLGETGVPHQVTEAFKTLVQDINELSLREKITSLTIDLFGFSRGAASARYAAYEINLGPKGALGDALKAGGIEWPDRVRVRFVGLFDTVAAIINPKFLDLSPQNGQNKPVEVYLDPEKVGKAVHLIASDEHRKNFALNSLRNLDGSLPDNFREISLPGVHSDIGGGYGESQREDILVTPLHLVPDDRTKWPKQSIQWDKLELLKQQKETEGWIGEFSLPVRSSEQLDPRPGELGPEDDANLAIYQNVMDHPAPDGRLELALRMVRQIRGEYSRVTLRLMHSLASQAGVPLKAVPHRADMTLPTELEDISKSLLEQVNEGEANPSLDTDQLNLLRQRYIHYSAHYNPLKFTVLETPISFRLTRNMPPNAPVQSRERIVHPNR